MTGQSDAQIESFVPGNAYDFIPRRISIAKNVQTILQTAQILTKVRNELEQAVIESILLLEYSSRLIQESNALTESRGLPPIQ